MITTFAIYQNMKTPLTLISLRIERRYWLTILAVLLALPAFPGHSSDRDREDRLVEEIEANLFDGELISLMPGADSFAAVQMASQTDTTRGGVILLHGRGFHADWPENIGPLRVGLSEAGWHTLSLQMPVLEKSAKYYDYVPILPEVLPRIDAALAHFKAANISPIVLLAHSCGAHMAMLWMEQYADQGIDAFVGIGMGATDYQQPMRHPFPFASLKVPVLDLYGELDYPAVHRLAPERLQLINHGGNPLSKQAVATGADHDFSDNSELLIKEVSDWLDSLGP
jgi:pimeloyl-ACP methyl ester carboxylesterase